MTARNALLIPGFDDQAVADDAVRECAERPFAQVLTACLAHRRKSPSMVPPVIHEIRVVEHSRFP